MLDLEQSVGWYADLVEAIETPNLDRRYHMMRDLHDNALGLYLPLIHNMNIDQAEEPISREWSRRDVVAHISRWEEWQLQAFRDPNPRRIDQLLALEGYQDPDPIYGGLLGFDRAADFNEHVVINSRRTPWSVLQNQAICTAKDLSRVFPPRLNSEILAKLENTPPHHWSLPGHELHLPGGWYLWGVSIEHEAVEHFQDLR